MILIDTSMLVDALAGPRRSFRALRETIDGGERILLATLVLYEWLRGPRRSTELAAQEALFPRESVIPLGAVEAECAADLYRRVPGARRREMDLAIAACAITRDARLWTLNPKDFADVPGLGLYRPA